MPAKRCPNCGALNAEDAEFCNMCREYLMGEVEDQSQGDIVITTDAGRWVGPNIPAPTAPRLARDSRRQPARRPGPRIRTRRPLNRPAFMLAGLGVGALVAGMVLFVVGLVDQFAFRGEARSLLPVDVADFSPFVSSVIAGAVLGGAVGALVALADSIWVGMASFAGIAMMLQGSRLPGGGVGLIFGTFVTAIAGVWGAAYGYLVSAAVHGVLEELMARPSD